MSSSGAARGNKQDDSNNGLFGKQLQVQPLPVRVLGELDVVGIGFES